MFLGLLDGKPRFGHGIAPQTADALKSREDLHVTDLRSIAVQGLVAPDHLPPIAEAKAVLHWHARHRFCPNCGAATALVRGGWKRDCPQCKAEHFPRTDPVVIMLASDGERCLLGRSPAFRADNVVVPRRLSWNRANRSKMQCTGKRAKKRASPAGALFISHHSRGHFRPR